MTKEDKIKVTTARVNKLAGSPKNFKCPGVLRKVQRQLRNLQK